VEITMGNMKKIIKNKQKKAKKQKNGNLNKPEKSFSQTKFYLSGI